MSDISSFFGQAAFDANSVEPQADFEVLPPGKYTALIEKAEVQQTKAQNGHFIYIEMKIIDGKFKERKLFDRINIENPNQQCVEIGRRCLSALCLAVGVQAASDTSQFMNQVVVAHVKVKNDQNEVRTYSSPSAAPLPAPATGPAPGPAPGPALVAPSTVAPAPYPSLALVGPLPNPAPGPAPPAGIPVYDHSAPAPAPAPAPMVAPVAPTAAPTQGPPWQR